MLRAALFRKQSLTCEPVTQSRSTFSLQNKDVQLATLSVGREHNNVVVSFQNVNLTAIFLVLFMFFVSRGMDKFLLALSLQVVGVLSYGVDVSFPIHHYLDPNSWAGKRYAGMMETCYKTYSKSECDNTESGRLAMSQSQPPSQHNYTQLGFAKVRAPESVWKPLREFYDKNIEKSHLERWNRANTYTNEWDSHTYFLSVEDPADGGSQELKQQIWDGAQPLLEEWVGQKLYATSLYGIRTYTEGSILSTHVDRLPLITSCIINVAQDVDEPWPIEVYAHDGTAYNVTMFPGDMVLYESSTVLHGRPAPLKGKYFANIFVHFKPYNHDLINQVDQLMNSDHHVGSKYSANQLDYHSMEFQRSGVRKQVANHNNKLRGTGNLRPDLEAVLHPNPNDYGYVTPLQEAILHQDLKLIQEICMDPDTKDQIHIPNSYGWYPLHMAVRTGDLNIVKFIVSLGVDLNLKTKHGGTALWWAGKVLSPVHAVYKYLYGLDALNESV